MKIDMKEDLNDIYWIDREICEYKVYIRKCKKVTQLRSWIQENAKRNTANGFFLNISPGRHPIRICDKQY